MRTVATMGDMFTEAQLRTIENQVKADQRQGLPLRIMRKMAEAEKALAKEEIAQIRGRVQWERHKKQDGLWKLKRSYKTQEEACHNYEQKLAKLEEAKESKRPLECGLGMFNSGKGTRTNKRVRDHVGNKTGSYLHVVRFANSKVTIVCKSKKTF